jgi:hypothetical protein
LFEVLFISAEKHGPQGKAPFRKDGTFSCPKNISGWDSPEAQMWYFTSLENVENSSILFSPTVIVHWERIGVTRDVTKL